MRTVASVALLRAELKPHRRAGRSIGFVPTMGFLHAGHLELVAQARAHHDVVVVSIFVNPLQFSPSEDLARYPRDLERDSALLHGAGVDVLFAPSMEEMYPRPMETFVENARLSHIHEGAARPGHFRGVATVVTKLFNMVQPDVAYFGEKDYQQLAVIRRMVEDLSMPVTVVGVPIVRAEDGLALSSRNVYLNPQERKAALVLSQSLTQADQAVASGMVSSAELEALIRRVISAEPLAEIDVITLCDAETLEPVGPELQGATAVMLAVRFGRTRLLDQRVIHRPQTISVAAE